MSTPNQPYHSEITPLTLEGNNGQDYGTIVVARRRPRRGCCSWPCCVISAICVIIIVVASFCFLVGLVTQELFEGCPGNNPLCWPWTPHGSYKALPNLSNETFTVGFHFTASYGTSAISFQNGTSVAIGKVNGDHVYRNYMARLSYEEAKHPSPPYYNISAASEDAGRQWSRYLRKTLGKPPSEDVAALTRVLNGLTSEVDSVLGDLGPFKYGTIAVPSLPAMYNEDLVDAAAAAGFQLTLAGLADDIVTQYPYTDVNFALSGMNLTDIDGEVLSISYTDDMLTVHTCAHGCIYYLLTQGIANPWLGRGAVDFYASPETYWSKVSQVIGNFSSTQDDMPRYDSVVVHGDRAMDKQFRKILQQEFPSYQLHSENPVFAGAIGAAKLGLACMLNRPPHICIPNMKVRHRFPS